jgi:hypothetical protein
MQLSQDLFVAIVGPALAVGRSGGEQRQADRFRLRQEGQCATKGPLGEIGPRNPCIIQEISRTGIGLIAPLEIAAGKGFVIWIKDAAGNESAVECRVVRTAPYGTSGRLFHLGAVFVAMHCSIAENASRQNAAIHSIRAAILS